MGEGGREGRQQGWAWEAERGQKGQRARRSEGGGASEGMAKRGQGRRGENSGTRLAEPVGRTSWNNMERAWGHAVVYGRGRGSGCGGYNKEGRMRRLQLHWERATKTVHQIPRSKTPSPCRACACGAEVVDWGDDPGVVLRCYKAAGEGGKSSVMLPARRGCKDRWR